MNAIQDCTNLNNVDDAGMPAGGSVGGVGLQILWQNGPLGRDGDRVAPNGAFVETVISAARKRIEWYQEVCGGRFRCDENARAIIFLEDALEALNSRTQRRERAGTEGTHAAE